MPYHLQGRMPQYLLKSKYITTINQESRSKRMSAQVCMKPLHSRPPVFLLSSLLPPFLQAYIVIIALDCGFVSGGRLHYREIKFISFTLAHYILATKFKTSTICWSVHCLNSNLLYGIMMQFIYRV